MEAGYIAKYNDATDSVEIVRLDKMEVPPHRGKIWLDGDEICLTFPAIENIRIADGPPLKIVAHTLHFRADEDGIRSAEAVVYIRQLMLQKGNEGVLQVFAQNGTDHSAILKLYKRILSGRPS